jgi:predicted DCC family thiol-disulfide oxidoreductase YuxK
MPAPLLLAYDPACTRCFRLALWLARRDTQGLLPLLDLRDPNLLALAPELGGRPIETEVHGLDLGTRSVLAGPELLGPVLRRLPGWRWVAPLFALPGLVGGVHRLFLLWASWRTRRTGRPPFA